MLIVEQQRSATSKDGLRELAQTLAEHLTNARFGHIQSESSAMRPAGSVAVIGVK